MPFTVDQLSRVFNSVIRLDLCLDCILFLLEGVIQQCKFVVIEQCFVVKRIFCRALMSSKAS